MSNSLKRRLAEGGRSIGSWASLGSPAIVEIMCAAGFEWVAVDLEHSTTTLERTEELIRVISLAGKTPLVRLGSNDPVEIKRVMDAGAHGVIVPNVKSGDEVRAASRAMHYPPRGERGVGLARAQGYGTSFDGYRAWIAESALLVPQIESREAVDRIDEILAIPDVDAFLVGPYDLSASLGVTGQFSHPDYVRALTRVREAGDRHGKPAGIHVVEPDPAQLRQRVAEGFRLIAYSVDFRMIDAASRLGLRALED